MPRKAGESKHLISSEPLCNISIMNTLSHHRTYTCAKAESADPMRNCKCLCMPDSGNHAGVASSTKWEEVNPSQILKHGTVADFSRDILLGATLACVVALVLRMTRVRHLPSNTGDKHYRRNPDYQPSTAKTKSFAAVGSQRPRSPTKSFAATQRTQCPPALTMHSPLARAASSLLPSATQDLLDKQSTRIRTPTGWDNRARSEEEPLARGLRAAAYGKVLFGS
jgi:hypothetical protein